MSWRFESIPHRRAIIDRRDLSDALIELGDDGDASIRRPRATQIMKEALAKGRTEINRRLEANPGRGPEISADRKSAVAGKSVCVRVDLGGGRLLKTQQQDQSDND